MDVLKILTALSPVYGFQVYGLGESEPDYEGSEPAKAMEMIEAQDECFVYLWAHGVAVGCLNIMMEDGQADIYDYGSRHNNVMALLDQLTEEC